MKIGFAAFALLLAAFPALFALQQTVEGLILDLRRRDRLVLSVSVLQRSMSVEIKSAWVTPVS